MCIFISIEFVYLQEVCIYCEMNLSVRTYWILLPDQFCCPVSRPATSTILTLFCLCWLVPLWILAWTVLSLSLYPDVFFHHSKDLFRINFLIDLSTLQIAIKIEFTLKEIPFSGFCVECPTCFNDECAQSVVPKVTCTEDAIAALPYNYQEPYDNTDATYACISVNYNNEGGK